MEEKRNDRWFLVSAGCIAVSILTLFLPIITYSEKRSGASVRVYRYAIQDFIFNGKGFADRVLWHYTGPVLWDIGAGTVLALALLFVVSIGLALAGILTMRTQYPNRQQFALTIAGLAGTAFLSLLVLLAVLLSGKLRRDDPLWDRADPDSDCHDPVHDHGLRQEKVPPGRAAGAERGGGPDLGSG